MSESQDGWGVHFMHPDWALGNQAARQAHEPAVRWGHPEFIDLVDLMKRIGDLELIKCVKCMRFKEAILFPKEWRYTGSTPYCQPCYDAWQKQHTPQPPPRDVTLGPIDMRRKAERMLRGVQATARKKSLQYDLTTDWCLDRLFYGHCEFTGLPFRMTEGGRSPFSPSIDKIVPARGYVRSNCRLVIWGYNVARSNFADADVLMIARAIMQAEGAR
jgi:hypothetical protein